MPPAILPARPCRSPPHERPRSRPLAPRPHHPGNHLPDRLEASRRQSRRKARPAGTDNQERANALLCFVLGRWQQLVRSGFSRDPLDGWAKVAPVLLSEGSRIVIPF